MRGKIAVLGVVLAVLTACQSGYVQDTEDLRGGRPAAKETVNLSDPAGDAQKAFAKGDLRRVHSGILPGVWGMTSAESMMFRGQKELTVEAGGMRAETKAGDEYAVAYNRALVNLIKAKTP